jgi:ABC-2 type transport system permease protein
MLARIAAFEVRYQLRAPLFAVGCAIFFLLTFGSVTMDEIQIGGKGNVNVNSPFAIAQTVAILGVFAVFIVTAFVANVIVRDDETGFAPLIQSTRITRRDYLVGRFAGATFVAFLVLATVPLAMLVGSWMPWLDPEKLGPFVASHYLYALFVIGLPTLFVMAAGFFALATVTRSMMWTYVGVVAFLVLFTTSRVLLRDPAYDTVASLTDPFGVSALARTTRYWTATDRNTLLPPLSGLMLYNRLIWLAVGLGLFLAAFWRFRFAVAGAPASGGAAATAAEAMPPASGFASRALPASAPGSGWRQFASLARFDMRFVFRSPAFFVLLAIGMFNAFGGMTSVVTQRGVAYFPVTRAMVEVLNGSFSIIPIIIAIYYAGELVWRDHDRRMHEIIGATAAPDWAFVLPKILAIAGVLASTYLASVLVATGFQLWHGYTRLEIGHYLLWFVVPGIVAAFLLAVLSVFVQVVVPHKFMGWAAMLVYVVAAISLEAAGFEHNLYQYAGAPPVPLSDMNGQGRFWIGHAWFRAYWLAFALVLVVLAYSLWRRGTEMRLAPRLRRLKARLAGVPGAVLAAGLASWVGMGVFIYWNTNVLNRYMTGTQREARLADYEKTLLAYEKVPQPRVADVKLAVDLYPREVKAVTRGEYAIENRTGLPLPGVHVRWDPDPRLSMTSLEVQGAKLEREYAAFHYRIYRFDAPMQPGERRTIRFATLLEERGFPNGRPLTRIVGNGTFLNNYEVAPIIGMDRMLLLTDRAKRRKHGLPADLRPPKLEDEGARANHYLRHDSDWVNADLVLTTDADQIPVAPGYTVSEKTEGGRRILHTRTEAPIMHFFSMQSARYAIKGDAWKPPAGDPVALAVYHHPAHDHNAQLMNDAMKASLDVFTTAFSPFQFRQARILEFPAYASFAQSFANTVPYSEAIGFIQNHPAKTADGDEKIDLVTYVTAHEIAHQWWAHQVIGADKQGMTMLSETFAQYSAMLVMERLYGPEMVRKFLKYELDSYLRSRGGEVVEELPLVRVENQGYIHYRKGTLVMYWLKEVVGEDVVNRALRRLIAQYAFKPAPYPSSSEFVALLREEAGPQHGQLITDLFEKITLYDMKAKDATSKRRPDGRFDVSFTVEAKKLYADGKGKETEAPLAEMFEVGAFSAQPGKKGFSKASVLVLERRDIASGSGKVTFVTDKAPSWVGIDPFNKRIDRNSDDNLVEVKSDS